MSIAMLEALRVDLLWTDFLNSEWHDWRGSGRSEDRLNRPDWLTGFRERWGLDAPVPPSAQELEALKAFRARLRRMAEALAAGEALTPEDLGALNGALGAGPVVQRLEPAGSGYRLDLVPAQPGWPGVLAEIAASFARTLADGEAARVRICGNPDCRWVFYDETRNRSKRFCDDKLCGNLMKVRRFRARRRADGGAQG